MATTIDLNELERSIPTPTCEVYTKATWSASWVKNETVLVQQARWTVAPSVSSATLYRPFGRVMMPGTSTIKTVAPVTNRGYFVLIRYQVLPNPPIWWLGYADTPVTVERYHSDGGGIQEIPCWGLDRALQYATLTTTVHENPLAEEGSETPKWIRKDGPSYFNRTRPGNRTESEIVVSAADVTPQVKRYLFANPSEAKPKFWSTREIFRHLVTFHLPTTDFGVKEIPFSAHSDANDLPNWDEPSLDLDGKTLHAALTELLGEDRLMGWSVQPNVTDGDISGPPVVEDVWIRPFTATTTPVTLPTIGTLPANRNVVDWVDSADPITDGELQVDDSEAVDQIIIRGPREIGIGSFRYVDDDEGELLADWDSDLEIEYDATEQFLPGWNDLTLPEKRERNDAFRSQQKYNDVYRRVSIRDDWNGTCDGDPLFVEVAAGEGETTPYIPYLGNVEVMDHLPLFSGIDYSGAADEVDESDGKQMLPILVITENEDDAKSFLIQDAFSPYATISFRQPNSSEYSVSVQADNGPGPGFVSDVSGAPPHAIWDGFFFGNDADPERINPRVYSGIDISLIKITAALIGDRRPQWAIPATVTGDLVRRKIITLEHPSLQHINIAAATVVGVDKDGDEVTSDGGVLRDPMAKLEALCRIASRTFVDPRRHLQIHTHRMISRIGIGNIVQTYNGAEAETVVREIIINTPVVNGDSPPPARMTIIGTNQQPDLVSLVGRIPTPEAGS